MTRAPSSSYAMSRYAAAIGLSMLAVTIVMANLFMNVLKRRGLAK